MHKFTAYMQQARIERRDFDMIICTLCRKEAYSFKNAPTHTCAKCET